MAEWRYSSTILNLSARWRWVVSFTFLPLYLWGNSFWYPFNRSLVGPQRLSGRYREEEKPYPNRESKLGRPAVSTPTEISKLLLDCKNTKRKKIQKTKRIGFEAVYTTISSENKRDRHNRVNICLFCCWRLGYMFRPFAWVNLRRTWIFGVRFWVASFIQYEFTLCLYCYTILIIKKGKAIPVPGHRVVRRWGSHSI
jgi:hypothetical protein